MKRTCKRAKSSRKRCSSLANGCALFLNALCDAPWHALLQTNKKTGFRGTNRVTNEPSPFAQLRFSRMLASTPKRGHRRENWRTGVFRCAIQYKCAATMHTSTRRKRAPPSASEVPPAKFHNRELGRTRRKSERCVAASSPKFCRLPTDAYALEPSARFFSLISYSQGFCTCSAPEQQMTKNKMQKLKM